MVATEWLTLWMKSSRDESTGRGRQGAEGAQDAALRSFVRGGAWGKASVLLSDTFTARQNPFIPSSGVDRLVLNAC